MLRLKDDGALSSRGKNLATHTHTNKELTIMKALGVILAVALVIALIILGPLLTIWAMNTLFPALAIPYTIWTWLSVLILGGVFKSNVTVKK